MRVPLAERLLRRLPGPLRSWWKEEKRTLPSRRLLRPLLTLMGIGLIPLSVLEINRRSAVLTEQNRARHREATAIVVASLASLRRTALDWGHWDDMYAYVTGRQPTFVDTDIATTSLFDDGGVLVLLDQAGEVLLTFSRAGKGKGRDQPLAACVQHNLPKLGATVSSSLRLACTNAEGRWLLGVGTPISNSASTAPRHGTLVMFEPLLRQEYGALINSRLVDLGQNLVASPTGEHLRIPPGVQGPDGNELLVAVPSTRRELLASLAGDLLRLLAVGLLLLGVRALLQLERRRQILVRRRSERRANQRIRRASRELDRLLARTGLDAAAPEADQRVMARLLAPQPALPGAPEPGLERQLEQLAGRFQHFLAGARSLALFDPLTQLPNRRYFIEHLELQAEQESGRSSHRFVILFIDIDRFKSINDTYGHAIGDALLVVVADRLRSSRRSCDFLARYGGDEFALLAEQSGADRIERGDARAAAYSLASRIATAFELPVQLPGVEIELSISIGIDLERLEAGKAEDTMKRCDIAMARAKQYKHTRVAVFDMTEGAAPIENYRLYVDLLQAVRDSKLEVVFQPIVAADGRIEAVEALSRWTHPELGEISPELFLELAERHRQMLLVGYELLRLSMVRYRELIAGIRALAGQRNSQDQAAERLPRLCLNLAPSMLSDPQLVERLESLLSDHGIEAGWLTIELTERSMIEPGPRAHASLEALRALGVRLSLDDFGTGYSSLQLLSVLRPDEVKIDKSFVMAMRNDHLARQIITMVAGMAPAMELEVVAEGVDHPATLADLRALGIRRFQGYLFACGLSAAALLDRCSAEAGGLRLKDSSPDPAKVAPGEP